MPSARAAGRAPSIQLSAAANDWRPHLGNLDDSPDQVGFCSRGRPPSLVKTEAVRDDCDMEHRMSDAELRKAIRVLRERADDARHRGNDDDANGIERTIRTYQEEMTQRL
ncbi:hypothetical protein I1A62_38490 [Rhodococcus sp. USK10]|nr:MULTISPECIES: hypothetical protein [Rhodococcus]QYB08225.1 hypothetical protein I1A62_38490 [Rhodococcus sp. USK10]